MVWVSYLGTTKPTNPETLNSITAVESCPLRLQAWSGLRFRARALVLAGLGDAGLKGLGLEELRAFGWRVLALLAYV